MSSISVRPFPDKEPVEVITLDFFTCGGEQLVTVEALSGKPFVGGDKWAIATPFATVKTSDLIIEPHEERAGDQEPVQQAEQPQPLNLLTLALAYQSKRQWYSGEVLYIWGDHKRGGAYLKEEGGFVRLSITHYSHSCLVFWLDRDGWAVSESLDKSYKTWATRAAEVLK
jgi:hypothetical protein